MVLDSRNDVVSIVRHAKELKKHGSYRNISLSFDKTPQQVAEYKALRATLDKRLQNGEPNLKIKYINGFPKIVSTNDNLN